MQWPLLDRSCAGPKGGTVGLKDEIDSESGLRTFGRSTRGNADWVLG